ncbi:hypothetical protein H5P36_19945 [Bacillus sp. APMAM]|nr:hypothetical protein [Bacillus sp. APMAM]RTZ54116.1 hypothetical protein EKO25_19725 [Bacillus sp. SAJ1]
MNFELKAKERMMGSKTCNHLLLDFACYQHTGFFRYLKTLAAHTDHVRYHMWGTNEILKNGKQPKMDWGKSWEIHSVDEQQWNRIQEGLRNEYLTLLESIDVIEWNEPLANELLSSLAHSAYHLGAIRQMLKVVKV